LVGRLSLTPGTSAGLIKILCVALCATLSGCADYDFHKAARLESKGKSAEAARAFERFLDKHPDDPHVPEAAYRAGAIHAETYGLCRQAVPLFEKAARFGGQAGPAPGLPGRAPNAGPERSLHDDASASSWPERARLALLSCPDYFPAPSGGRWEYVDTLSGGQNMRLEIEVRGPTGPGEAVVAGAYFAGEEKFREYRRVCGREGWSLWEEESGVRVPVLRFPFRKGHAWEAVLKGERVRFLIEDDSATVKVKAGTFSGCLKVKQHHAGFESWTYDYFCPGVGRVKTTVGVPGAENPNTELASYKLK
jgi:hypothetical protein